MIRSWFCFVLFAPLAGAQTPSDQAWTTLTDAAQNKSADTRTKAIQSLGILGGNARAREMAERALSDSEYQVRSTAADELGKMKATESIPKLKAALNDPDAAVVIAAANALYAMNDPAAYEIFYAVLRGERKSGASLKESQQKMLNDPKAMAKVGFEAGIGFIPFAGGGYSLMKVVMKDGATPVRAAAALKLARDPDPKAAEGLRDTVGDKKWLVRAAAIDALAERDDTSALPIIMTMLGDDNEVVRFTAAAAVIRLTQKPSPGVEISKKP